jgi:hypothetical protein
LSTTSASFDDVQLLFRKSKIQHSRRGVFCCVCCASSWCRPDHFTLITVSDHTYCISINMEGENEGNEPITIKVRDQGGEEMFFKVK